MSKELTTNNEETKTEKRARILDELTKIVSSGKMLGYSEEALSKYFNITRVTLRSYLKKIYNSIPREDIKQTEVKVNYLFKRIFKEAEKGLDEAITPKEKREAMDFLLKTIKEHTDFMERFGIKMKAPDFHYHNTQQDDKNINIEVVSVESKFDEEDDEEDE